MSETNPVPSQPIEIPVEAVAAAGVALGRKLHWFTDTPRMEELARCAIQAALDSGWLIEPYDQDSAGAELSRMESDMLEIHDELESMNLHGVINADSIIERIKKLAEDHTQLVEALNSVAGTATIALSGHGSEDEIDVPGSGPFGF